MSVRVNELQNEGLERPKITRMEVVRVDYLSPIFEIVVVISKPGSFARKFNFPEIQGIVMWGDRRSRIPNG